MNSSDLKRGAQIATAVAAVLLASGCMSGDDGTGVTKSGLKCVGGNECKGMSECAGGPSSNSCEGMNECKGMGWSYTDTAEECEAAGGMVES